MIVSHDETLIIHFEIWIFNLEFTLSGCCCGMPIAIQFANEPHSGLPLKDTLRLPKIIVAVAHQLKVIDGARFPANLELCRESGIRSFAAESEIDWPISRAN